MKREPPPTPGTSVQNGQEIMEKGWVENELDGVYSISPLSPFHTYACTPRRSSCVFARELFLIFFKLKSN